MLISNWNLLHAMREITCWYQIGGYCLQREKRVQNNGISSLKSSEHRWHVRHHWDDWLWYEKHHSQTTVYLKTVCVMES